jgi:hypothetical protein
MALVSSKAEKIVDAILSSNDEMLLISIRDWSGNILAVKYRESFTKRFFGASRLIGTRYSGSLIVSTLSLANEEKDVFGEAQAIITIYKDFKVMLLPMPLYEVIVGIALERSAADKEEVHNIANGIGHSEIDRSWVMSQT